MALTSLPLLSGSAYAQAAPVTLSGTVFEDHNGNGIRDAEDQDIACTNGAVVLQTVPDNGSPLSTNSAADGSYSFTGVAPGTYTITAACQYAAFPDEGPGMLPIQSAVVTAQPTNPIVVGSTDVSGLDFGMFFRPSLVGQAYLDSNGDGTRQGDEPGLDGCAVTATDGTDVQQTTTAPTTSGLTRFSRPGIFEIVLGIGTTHIEVACDGYDPTSPPIDVVARSNEPVGVAVATCDTTQPPSCIADGDAPRFGFAPIATTTMTTAPAGDTTDTLPRTGSRDARPLTILGLALVLVGAAFAFGLGGLARRRRSARG